MTTPPTNFEPGLPASDEFLLIERRLIQLDEQDEPADEAEFDVFINRRHAIERRTLDDHPKEAIKAPDRERTLLLMMQSRLWRGDAIEPELGRAILRAFEGKSN